MFAAEIPLYEIFQETSVSIFRKYRNTFIKKIALLREFSYLILQHKS